MRGEVRCEGRGHDPRQRMCKDSLWMEIRGVQAGMVQDQGHLLLPEMCESRTTRNSSGESLKNTNEMTQEEKAKRYDEALEKARKYRDEEGFTEMEDLFPELAENEDEKMIDGLQGFLSAFGSDFFGTGGWQKFDEWLEKQKEQEPIDPCDASWDAYYRRGYERGLEVGRKEQKPTEKHDLVAQLKEHLANTLKEQLEAEWKELEEWDHVGPQLKLAGWSEEDERRRDGIIQWLREYQKKFNPEYDSLSIESIESLIDWFKSLRPSWKPSEAHLSALLAVFNDPDNIGSQTCQLALTDLYEQLKAIREDEK